MSEDIVKQLHELADWIEKHNNVHCHSVPRKAAYTLERLEEENTQMRLSLNKRDLTFGEMANRYIGYIRLILYKVRNRKIRVERKKEI